VVAGEEDRAGVARPVVAEPLDDAAESGPRSTRSPRKTM
jgi:hypothetical protein